MLLPAEVLRLPEELARVDVWTCNSRRCGNGLSAVFT